MELEQHVTPATVKAIYESYETRNVPRHSRRLGASQIGGACDRAIWYGFRHVAMAQFDGRMLRLFDTGHREEARVIEDLRAAGVTVYDIDPDTGEQFTFTAVDGHFVCKLDGAGEGFKESAALHVIEIKTMNAKGFALLKKDGAQKTKPLYWAQCQIAMHLSKTDRCALIVVCKDTDEIYMERIKLDQAEAMKLIARAEKIIYTDTLPQKISADPSFWQCKFCDYFKVCHQKAEPLVNCRTCAHATPERTGDGAWSCAKSCDMTKPDCPEHLFSPELVPYEPQDAGEGWVEYLDPDTDEIKTNTAGQSKGFFGA